MITSAQWELIDKKYGRLLTTICSKISGDVAIANFDDNLQDLRIATLEAVAGFSKKEGKTFEEFWGTTGFNKYMKTCLWNLKNKKGARISKRYHIHKNTVDITAYGDILVAENADPSSISFESFFKEKGDKFNEEQNNAIRTVSNHPELIKPSGKINIRQLSNKLGCCAAKTRKILNSIKNKINLDL
tara:strand:- start:821 stop:1381 length:561 start_codon:yes stop_codon:yes gene_type:complete